MRRLRTCVRGLCVLLPVILAACAGAPPAPEPPVVVHGSGRPVVVLVSGFGMDRSAWQAVTDALSPDFTVAAVQRPGYGRQSDTDRPRDPCSIAAETHQALVAAGLPPPYLLVGHSLGGLYQYVFARLYPQDVAGVVLLDPTHPKHWQMLQTQLPMTARALQTAVQLYPSQARRNEFLQQTECLDRLSPDWPSGMPVRLQFSRRYRDMERDMVPALQTLQQDWLSLTGATQSQRIWDSGHQIPTERPDAVAQAVGELAGRAIAIRPPTPVTLDASPPLTLTPGRTRQEEVSQALGTPDEIHHDGTRTIWVYRAPGLRVPVSLGLVPVIGDIAELAQLAQAGTERCESIIEFDEQRVVRRARCRRVED